MHQQPSWFAHFAQYVAHISGRPVAFTLAVATILVWGVMGPFFGYSDTWQLVINTATTIVTFLMVALLQNAGRRSEVAMHEKLDALADGLADFMEHSAPEDAALQNDMRELRAAVGIERP